MKSEIPFPQENLHFFSNQLLVEDREWESISRHQGLFVSKKEDFAQFFYDYFCGIEETKAILEHATSTETMKKVWGHWFESLFGERFDESFLHYMWRSGLRHVELHLDQRFVSLAYAIARQYCHRIARAEVPDAEVGVVSASIDKIIDLCLLIETHAYVAGTAQCDIEVIKGIAHQIRNPLTIIGGNISRLQKKLHQDNPNYKVYEMIMAENSRLERMVIDIGIYSDMFQKEPKFSVLFLDRLIAGALEKLKRAARLEGVTIDSNLIPEFNHVQGDPDDLEMMFLYLFQNSLEAIDKGSPYLRISSRILVTDPRFLEVEIFNNGTPPSQEQLENLFVPFFSSKPYGTGFGLPIAQLAARKSLGELYLEPLPDQGTRCVIRLAVPTEGKNVTSHLRPSS